MIANGGGEVEIELGGVTVKLKITLTGSGNILTDIGKYTVLVTVEDERFTLPSGSVTMTVEAPAVAAQDGLSPLMIGIISAVAVLAVLIVIVIIVVIKRKPVESGSSDGFDDYVE